jgi:hypothetical protein
VTGGDLIRLRNGDRVRLRGWGFFLSARLFHWNAGWMANECLLMALNDVTHFGG